jgi:hypothetical protein
MVAGLTDHVWTVDELLWTLVSTGLVNDMPSVAELVSRITSDAEMIILERLSELSR